MKSDTTFLARPYVFCMAAVMMLVASVASAQEAKTAEPAAPTPNLSTASLAEAPPSGQASTPVMPQGQQKIVAEDDDVFYEPLQVGDATQALLALQSSGEIAAATERPISSAVAIRSYERYLKSFEFPIPERMTSSVKSTSGGSGSSGK